MSSVGISNFGLKDYSDNYQAFSDALKNNRAMNEHGAFVIERCTIFGGSFNKKRKVTMKV